MLENDAGRPGGGGNPGRSTDGPASATDGPSACDQQACDPTAQDGCCPAACNSTSDADCNINCGNGVIEPGETCDPPGSCPTACPNRACTGFALQGAADQCTARCAESGQITGCTDGDGCCPTGCTADTDKDCLVVCGNGTKEGSETCDPLSSCPTECPPLGCQLRKLVNAGTCAAECIADAQQTKCQPDDGCCPSSCNANNDPDCAARCGNGIKEQSETCDPCPIACPPMGCQLRRLEEAGTCNARCVDDRKETACKSGDGCCPDSCNAGNDNDCNAKCGNGIKEGAELCDPCPSSCAPQGCMLRKLENPGSCNARCVEDRQQTQCLSGDGCCPGNCNANNDNDCKPRCGNDAVESGELCDGNCPSSCNSNGCNLRKLEGSGCNVRCVDAGQQTQCHGGDGCCPDNCNANNDSDCKPQCGNRVVESGETCDGNCPNAGDCSSQGCNLKRLEGSGCNIKCVGAGTQTQCRSNDDCCPSGCNAGNDNDCDARCGNNITEPGEECDKDCPRSCPNQGCDSFSPQGSPCHVHCARSGTLANGTRCGGDNACFGGQCRFCPDSGGCNSDNPCKNGVNRCNGGVPSCADGSNKADGTACGGGRQCLGGECRDCPNSGDCTMPNTPTCKLTGIRCVKGRSSCQVVGNTPRNEEGPGCGGDRACDGRGACKLKDDQQCSRPGADECLGTCFGNCRLDPEGKFCTKDSDCDRVMGDTCLQDDPACH